MKFTGPQLRLLIDAGEFMLAGKALTCDEEEGLRAILDTLRRRLGAINYQRVLRNEEAL